MPAKKKNFYSVKVVVQMFSEEKSCTGNFDNNSIRINCVTIMGDNGE